MQKYKNMGSVAQEIYFTSGVFGAKHLIYDY